MTANYEEIRRDNIEEYGRGLERWAPRFLDKLYSDETHFVYELLQNAEDAGASRVKFTLYSDCLEFEHDGRDFTERDVQAICGLADTEKYEDITQIGRFGLGFKSVHAYTRSPEVHSGDEHFAIDKYVQPREIESRYCDLGTQFRFPFNHKDKTSASSHADIAGRLKDLGVRTLLFLNNLDSIEYDIVGDSTGTYLRQCEEEFSNGFARAVRVIGRVDMENAEEEQWLVFRRAVSDIGQDDVADLAVEIAFQMAEMPANLVPQFQRVSDASLVVFFPTDKATKLGFLIQGPFRTTPARDNIPERDEFNLELVHKIGALVVDALRWLRDKEWLTVEVLQAMPLAYRERQDSRSQEQTVRKYDEFLEPLYKKVKNALRTEELIPSAAGGYVSACSAKIAGSLPLRKLLDNAQMTELQGFHEQIRWISDDITRDRTPHLWRYLTSMLQVDEFDTEKFVGRIDRDFMLSQSDEWIRSFYEFAPTGYAIKNTLKEKPIIRLADGCHVSAVNDFGKPQAYLPTDHESRFPTVSAAVCSSEKSLTFLEHLGLREPDKVDEVVELILPKYEDGAGIDDLEHDKDIKLIVLAMSVDSWKRKQELESKLKPVQFLRARSAAGKTAYCNPNDLYFRTDDLECYFCDNPNAWFISGEYEEYKSALIQLGVANSVRVCRKKPEWNGHVTLEKWHGRHVRGLDGFDPNWKIDGIDFALNHPSVERSQVVWNSILIPHKRYIKGEIESCTRQNFAGSTTETKLSSIGQTLCKKAWLPNGSGAFVRPSVLSIEDLPDGFRKDDDLAGLLGMQKSITAILESSNIPDDMKRKMEVTENLSLEQLVEAVSLLTEKEQLRQNTPETMGPERYQSEVIDVFNSPDAAPTGSLIKPITPIRKTSDSRQNHAERDISNEPDAEERYQLNVQRKWDPKNPETRRFLYNEYGGECQICGDTFVKSDGENYFEAVHIIPRTSAKFLDHQRNALCLCANHSKQFLYGVIATPDEDVIAKILSSEESQQFEMDIMLCGEPQTITFSPNHIDELKGGLEASKQF